ncbi:MAG: toll/interleukin-1 receptor domain-containing protein [Anaerolineae bacterium]|nr:toll/interleukin-1 receptor domain-containing protein [Anaerolineae bacterium]
MSEAPPRNLVFVSYSRSDAQTMERVYQWLKAAGFDVWVDRSEIEPGTPQWRSAISAALDRASCVVAIFSQAAKDSYWVQDELSYALARDVKVFPLRREDVLIIGFAGTQWIDIQNDKRLEEGMPRLIEAIRAQMKSIGVPVEEKPPISLVHMTPASVDPVRKLGQMLVILACCVVVLLALWDQFIGPALPGELLVADDVNLLIGSHRWITYDPREYDPSFAPEPDPEAMAIELGWIHSAGFDGVITFTMRGAFAQIPELAQAAGLNVIAGVWDPNDPEEIRLAISARDYVDAYAVGHNGLDRYYAFDELERAIRQIRYRTRRPVTTTEKAGRYLVDPQLFAIGDWVFPDVHVSVQDVNSDEFFADALRDSSDTIQTARMLAQQPALNGRPILLKMVTYPIGGVTNASALEQSSFYTAILDDRRSVLPNLPSNVWLSVHSAFDTPWKRAWPFYEWDAYTGLLNDDGSARPAADAIIQRLP